ncbi:MAG TPA: xanthine dehydrogenase family protein molybdopterin-binding subunit [Bacteroidota bacterium]|nr:xanthine dehydrogenase family protein molybdopterin-binding subunit [Bacteroidota bacterium]
MIASPVIGRRRFLQVVSVAGAGLALGFYLPELKRHSDLFEDTAENFAPNAWLRIDPSGETLITVSKSEMGQGIITGMPMILAEELGADWTKVRIALADASDKYGSMSTGGSSTTRSMWKPLRHAGAAAREMLIAAAAHKWGVAPDSCRAEQGNVIHPPSKRKFGFGELVDDAAKLPVPADPPLKEEKDFQIVGKPTHRLDSAEKVDGSATFGIDVRVPGMVYAVVARCPVFGGKVKSFDGTNAKAVPGVSHVLQIEEGVAVVADNTWDAIQGRKALDIEWDEGPNAAMSSASIHAMLEEYAKKPGAVVENVGDIAALDTAPKKVDATYELPFLAHATMEPMNSTADVRSDRCEIWAPTQNPQLARRSAADALGLNLDSVTVHTTLLGGGFGRRFEPDFVMEAVHVSKAVGAPVKVVWTREDDMQHDWYRPTSMHHLIAGLDDKGEIVALRHTMTGPSVTGQRSPERIKGGLDRGALEGGREFEYDIPNYRVEFNMANTGVPTGWLRSVYAGQNIFAVESFIDELAYAAKMDPYEFRRRTLKQGSRSKNVLEIVAEKSGWGSPLPNGHFRGIACVPAVIFGSYVAHVAEISVEGNSIRVHRVVTAVDCGTQVNPDQIKAQIEGSVAFGLTIALKGEITIDKGRVVQGNFDDYMLLSIDEMPKVEVYLVSSNEALGGMGEPGVPPFVPAIANAVFAATGKRLRKLPLKLA